MLVRPANFLILDEPTNHLDMRSQDILQQAVMEYEGTLLIVSHNRAFLDPIISKTIEFRQGHDPRLFHGNLSYYLDKSEAEEKARKAAAQAPQKKKSAPLQPIPKASPKKENNTPSVNRKDQRKAEAAARQALAPLKSDLEKLEDEIAIIEAKQATLSTQLSLPEVATDTDKFQETTTQLATLTDKLNKAYSRWDTLTAEIEALEATLSA